MPKTLSKLARCFYLVLSLGTKDQAVTRRIAAILDSGAVAMVEMAETDEFADHQLSGARIKGMFRNVALGYLAKLDRFAEFDRSQSGSSVADSKRTDIVMVRFSASCHPWREVGDRRGDGEEADRRLSYEGRGRLGLARPLRPALRWTNRPSTLRC